MLACPRKKTGAIGFGFLLTRPRLGRQVFVIATGLVATFLQTAILAVSAALGLSYTLAMAVQVAQLVANAMMLALIFARVRQ